MAVKVVYCKHKIISESDMLVNVNKWTILNKPRSENINQLKFYFSKIDYYHQLLLRLNLQPNMN